MLCYYMCDDLKDMNDIVRIDMNTEFVLPHNVRSHRFVVPYPDSLFLSVSFFETVSSWNAWLWNQMLGSNVTFACLNRLSTKCTRTYVQLVSRCLTMYNFTLWWIRKIRDQSFTVVQQEYWFFWYGLTEVWRLEFDVYIFCREEQKKRGPKIKSKKNVFNINKLVKF